ncbi:MAG: selenobiotic family peptide radical SAM maturase [Desulfobulbaceae bacterium]|nr:MAG: selenobiotic family peptide radical SAM maturase [Desulfobulbaceae bacterium]
MSSDCCRCRQFLAQMLPAEIDMGDQELPDWLACHAGEYGLPPFLSELARLETLVDTMAEDEYDLTPPTKARVVNPSLQMVQFPWRNLVAILAGRDDVARPGEQLVLVWKQSGGAVRYKNAEAQDLLALKLIDDSVDLAQAAQEHQVSLAYLDTMLERAAQEEMILVPVTTIRRDATIFKESELTPASYLSSNAFTLQWHITQACDLHCKHCYDRSSRRAVAFDQALAVLEDFRSFCQQHHVYGQVTFTGGNPLLYPRFAELYRAAAEHGFQLAILGNPVEKAVLEELQDIQPLEFYQVSLEGLASHNDHIRGAGHFQRVVDFLALLKGLGIYSMVMLTLTRENQDQVLPLADFLRDKVDLFNFNRLAMVGEGARLLSAPSQGYEEFLRSYDEASAHNPCMGLKDNHLNTLFVRQGREVFGGCTGYGCGAAFNFLSLLADGEVHACRKFPSYIGNISDSSLTEIYHAEAARRYRAGSRACDGCSIRAVCGGCLAVTHGMGLNIFADKDPYCFFD